MDIDFPIPVEKIDGFDDRQSLFADRSDSSDQGFFQ
jgi:hypothetical protein